MIFILIYFSYIDWSNDSSSINTTNTNLNSSESFVSKLTDFGTRVIQKLNYME